VADETLFTIGDVSRRLNIPVTTLRFYEKEFPTLLKAHRTSGGHRRYTQANLEAFRFIKETSQRIPLREIKSQTPDPSSAALEEKLDRLQEALLGLDQRIRKLEESLSGMQNRVAVVEEKSKKKWFR
jgi:DNA-binding transcriptional MerR regulator